jgi:hypothetical protein
MLAEVVEELVGRYLRHVDTAIPGAVEGFYVVGSTALGAFRAGRSDLDFVAVVARQLGTEDLRRLRRMHRRLYAADLALTLRRMPWKWPLTCNGVYVTWADLTRSSLTVAPAASHTSWHFTANRGFDVNPVTWHILAEHGIAVRGPAPGRLLIHQDEAELRSWCLENLDGYWRRWASAVPRPGLEAVWFHLLQTIASGVLGAPRLHCTVLTGDIISKEQAGEYALATFGQRWRPIIEEALAYWRGELTLGPFRLAHRRRREAARFVLEVVESAAAG